MIDTSGEDIPYVNVKFKKTLNEVIVELSSSVNNLIKNKEIFNNKKIKSTERVKNFNWINKILKI